MFLARLLPLLLLLPALSMADSDKNFRIPSKHFKAGTVVDPIADMAIRADHGAAVSEGMTFPLKENRIYLRHKVGPKEYQWVSGNLVVENLKKLHAFSLKKNYLKPEDVAVMRFYGSKNMKAFQDEADLYFDRHYIYSPRVPKLYFIKNGQWQILNETTIPGAIVFSTNEKNIEISSMKRTYAEAPKMLFPKRPGVYAYVFSAPNSLPYVDVGVVEEGSALQFKPNFIKIEKDLSKKPPVTVTLNEIEAAETLEKTEQVYDRFVAELEKATEGMDNEAFESTYPQMVKASFLGVNEDNKDYAEYVVRYNLKKVEAKKMWRESKVGDVSYLNKALRKKLDSLEALPLRGTMMPTAIEPIFVEVPVDESVDSAKAVLAKKDSAAQKPATKKEMGKLKMTFGTDHSRVDFAWAGVASGLSIDTLYSWIIKKNPALKIRLFLRNNKPVWIYKDGVVSGRHHYRYDGIEFLVGEDAYTGQGEFILPEYIYNEPEVQEWLRTKDVPSSSSEAVTSSSSKAAPVDIKMPTLANLATSARIIRDKDRGPVALIDSGSFRYKGHVVAMSPFAIMTTEMTQQLFEKTMKTLDSAKRIADRSTYKHPNKPVHNITWDDARAVCQVFGGDLPSEAQWEFAALADNVEGAVWVKDSVPSPGAYAVYRGNSYNLGTKFPDYGPQPVGGRKPNAWGLHDMSGNVAEWTRDRYFMFSFVIEPSNPTGAMFGSNKVYKGGSWKDGEKLLNVTNRDDEDPRYWSETIGFRCVYPRELIKE